MDANNNGAQMHNTLLQIDERDLLGYIFYGDDKIVTTCPVNLHPTPRGLGYEFFIQMKKNSTTVAQIVAATEESETYDDLLKKCIRTAMAMRNMGVNKNDVVCICSEDNHLNSCVPVIASLFIGAKPVSIEPDMLQSDVVHYLKSVSPKIIFVVPEGIELIEDAVVSSSLSTDVVVFGATSKHLEFSSFISEKPNECSFQPIVVEDLMETAVLNFSSGTSGMPKPICVKHYSHFANTADFINSGTLFFHSRLLNMDSLYWGLCVTFLSAAILTGTTRIICRSNEKYFIWSYIQKYEVSLAIIDFCGANRIMKRSPLSSKVAYKCKSLKNFLVVGGRMNEQYLLQLRNLLPETNILTRYGLTEVGLVTRFRPKSEKDMDMLRKKVHSCGLPINGMSYKVVDVETEKILGFNEKGEIRIKSKALTNGYYNASSASVFDADGWFKTGDVGYYDEDFCFYIVDRIKDVIIHLGDHVSPAALEEVILTHPAVKEAVVFGTPDEIDGYLPTALVVLRKTAKHVTSTEIKDYVDNNVDEIKKLRGGLKIVERLLYTPTNKCKRNDLKKLYLLGKI